TISALLAQEPTAPPTPVVLKSTTRLVQVSVIAQDGKGQPVTDLKKEDFRIKVNGKDQPIKIFSMDSSGALPQGETKLPPNVFTNRMEVKPGQQSSVTIILLDTLNTKWADQVFAKAQVIRYLRTLQPSDHIGLYTLGNALRVLHDYTADSAELLARLEALKGKELPDMSSKEPTDAMHGDALLLDALQRGAGGASPAERSFYTTIRVIGTLKAIEFIANHLANTPGRKNLIWVSGGFPLEIGFDSAAAWRNPQIDQRTFSDEVSETVRAVNEANMAIYPVDARGLMVDPRYDPSRQGPTNVRAMTKAPGGMVGVKNQETMNELASRTGGHAYYNSNDLEKAIHSAVEDSRVTYMLGFYPVEESFDGKFHKIEVQMVERKGVHLRYRKGFFDLPELPQDEKARKTELADAAWSPLDASGIGIAAKIVPSKTKPGSLEIILAIDSSQVSLERQAENWVGRLDVLFIQRDNAGNQYNGTDDTLTLRLNADSYAKFLKNGFVYNKVVDRADRAKTIRIVVRDSASGAIGSITVALAKIS
ncbi:MAG TPA: VWA domain-containing protein, partial [Bryobacteraceae bacterium]|nr:VWA domain-containing protein [Bryobacteraceae bacterium]